MPDLNFAVAGGMTLRCGDRLVDDEAFAGRQLRLVAAVLLLDRSEPVPVDRIVEALWPNGPPEQYRPAVRGLVSKVRRLLAEVGIETDRIQARPGLCAVDLPQLQVDIESASQALSEARSLLEAGDFDAAGNRVGAARAVLSRPVLPGVDADWVDAVRDRVSAQHVESLMVLGMCRVQQGKTTAARTVASEAMEIAPLREGWGESHQVV